MAEKERRMKMKRQQEEIRQQQQQQQQQSSQKPQEPFYVVKAASDAQNKDVNKSNPNLNKDMDNISWPDTDSKLSMQGLSILAPILLCLCIMFIYIVIGTIVLYKIDNLRPIDGFYFCFMSLSTIGFGNLIPGHTKHSGSENTTLWFCSIYILSGLALTAMCFNVVHDEIVHRLKHQQKEWSQKGNAIKDEVNLRDPFYIASWQFYNGSNKTENLYSVMEETTLCNMVKTKIDSNVISLDDVVEEGSTIGAESSVSDLPITEFSGASCNGEDEIVAIVTKKDTINSVNMVAYNFLPEMLSQVINTTPWKRGDWLNIVWVVTFFSN